MDRMIYGYIRVSTDKQTVQNQKIGIREYARQNNLHGIKWYSETISGTKNVSKRQLGALLEVLQPGDTVIITELSRLGRSMLMILEVVKVFLDKKIKVVAIKEGFTIEDNLQSKVLIFAFSLSAELERTLLSERTKLGLERARKQGKQIGRKPGQKPKKYKLSGKGAYIKREVEAGRSINSLAKELGVTWATLKSFCKKIHVKKYPNINKMGVK